MQSQIKTSLLADDKIQALSTEANQLMIQKDLCLQQCSDALIFLSKTNNFDEENAITKKFHTTNRAATNMWLTTTSKMKDLNQRLKEIETQLTQQVQLLSEKTQPRRVTILNSLQKLKSTLEKPIDHIDDQVALLRNWGQLTESENVNRENLIHSTKELIKKQKLKKSYSTFASKKEITQQFEKREIAFKANNKLIISEEFSSSEKKTSQLLAHATDIITKKLKLDDDSKTILNKLQQLESNIKNTETPDAKKSASEEFISYFKQNSIHLNELVASISQLNNVSQQLENIVNKQAANVAFIKHVHPNLIEDLTANQVKQRVGNYIQEVCTWSTALTAGRAPSKQQLPTLLPLDDHPLLISLQKNMTQLKPLLLFEELAMSVQSNKSNLNNNPSVADKVAPQSFHYNFDQFDQVEQSDLLEDHPDGLKDAERNKLSQYAAPVTQPSYEYSTAPKYSVEQRKLAETLLTENFKNVIGEDHTTNLGLEFRIDIQNETVIRFDIISKKFDDLSALITALDAKHFPDEKRKLALQLKSMQESLGLFLKTYQDSQGQNADVTKLQEASKNTVQLESEINTVTQIGQAWNAIDALKSHIYGNKKHPIIDRLENNLQALADQINSSNSDNSAFENTIALIAAVKTSAIDRRELVANADQDIQLLQEQLRDFKPQKKGSYQDRLFEHKTSKYISELAALRESLTADKDDFNAKSIPSNSDIHRINARVKELEAKINVLVNKKELTFSEKVRARLGSYNLKLKPAADIELTTPKSSAHKGPAHK
jgi:hypothetical protein